MTPRSIRRAAERKAMKAARKATARQQQEALAAQVQAAEPPTPDLARLSDRTVPSSRLDVEDVHMKTDLQMKTDALCWAQKASDDSADAPLLFTPAPLSPSQLAANRANAQDEAAGYREPKTQTRSSGPTSPEGRTKSSLNAVKTGLTGRTVLLPTDDAPEYERHLRAYSDEFSPVGQRESDLVQSIADTMWRLKRIPCLENAIFAQGHMEFAEAFNQHDAPLRAGMIEVQTFIKYERQLRNLQLQESRLARRREKEIAELRQLQQERRSKEREALETVSRHYLAAQEANESFEPAANGFVFSIPQIEQHLASMRARNLPRTAFERTGKQAA